MCKKGITTISATDKLSIRAITRGRFEDICRVHGLNPETDIDIKEIAGGGWDMTASSPKGKVFNASGCHYVAQASSTDSKGMIYAFLAHEIQSGFQDCKDPGCEHCNPEKV